MTGSKALQRAPSLVDRLVFTLRDEITQGQHAAGHRLPTESQLAVTYGVSRPIVREALGRLKQDGLVLSRQGSGLFVGNPIPASIFRLPAPDLSNREEIRHVIELLIAVEAAASEHAARRRSAEQMAAIDACVAAMQRAIDRGDAGVDEDLAFHRAIIEASGNPLFIALSGFLDTQARRFIRIARANTSRSDGLTEAVQDEHVAICEAIRQQDSLAARDAAEQHLQNAAGRLAIYVNRSMPDAVTP